MDREFKYKSLFMMYYCIFVGILAVPPGVARAKIPQVK